MAHDADLLPALTSKLEDLLSCIPAEQQISYDVQGLADQGTDVAVRLSSGTKQHYLCFQVKSHRELMEGDLTGKLRQQHSESVDRYGNKALWCPVLAADISQPVPDLQRRLRAIRNAFVKKPRTMVIDPGHIAGFLRLTHTDERTRNAHRQVRTGSRRSRRVGGRATPSCPQRRADPLGCRDLHSQFGRSGGSRHPSVPVAPKSLVAYALGVRSRRSIAAFGNGVGPRAP